MKPLDKEDLNDNTSKKSRRHQSDQTKSSAGKRRKYTEEGQDSVGTSITSMLGSLILVVIAVVFTYSYKSILIYHSHTAPAGQSTEAGDDSYSLGKEYLELDEDFEPVYIMMYNVPEGEVTADFVPGKKDTESVELKNGQVYLAQKKGTYKGGYYYRVADEIYGKADNLYIEDDIDHVMILKSYTELTGNVVITFVSSQGVRIHSWADYDADNVVKSAYVGDKIEIIGKVVTKSDVSMFMTKDGNYITTDSRYLNDYTNVVSAIEATEESEDEEETTASTQTPAGASTAAGSTQTVETSTVTTEVQTVPSTQSTQTVKNVN